MILKVEVSIMKEYYIFIFDVAGNNYNIPVCIWILDTHPYNPPMAYVRPTPVMQIKPNQYVDANGKVDLPYLRDWKHVSFIYSSSMLCKPYLWRMQYGSNLM